MYKWKYLEIHGSNSKSLPHNHNFSLSMHKKLLENIMRKGENAGNQHFLPYSQCLLPFSKQISRTAALPIHKVIIIAIF